MSKHKLTFKRIYLIYLAVLALLAAVIVVLLVLALPLLAVLALAQRDLSPAAGTETDTVVHLCSALHTICHLIFLPCVPDFSRPPGPVSLQGLQ